MNRSHIIYYQSRLNVLSHLFKKAICGSCGTWGHYFFCMECYGAFLVLMTWTMIACAVIGIAISMYSLLCREILEANVVQTFRLWIWLFYFILGSNMDKFTRFIQKYLSLRMHIFWQLS